MFNVLGCIGNISNIFWKKCLFSMTESVGKIWNIHKEMGKISSVSPFWNKNIITSNHSKNMCIDVYFVTVIKGKYRHKQFSVQ